MTDQDEAQICEQCGHPLGEHAEGGLCMHEFSFDFCSCGDYYTGSGF